MKLKPTILVSSGLISIPIIYFYNNLIKILLIFISEILIYKTYLELYCGYKFGIVYLEKINDNHLRQVSQLF